MSDVELAKKVIEKDRDAIAELYKRYQERLYAYALLMLKDEQLASDAVMDFFYKLLRNGISGFDLDRPLAVYLIISVRHIVLDHMKRSKRKNELYSSYIQHLEHPKIVTPYEQLRSEEVSKVIDQQIERLPPEERKVLKLSWEKHKNPLEIAEILGKPVSTVNRQLGTSRKKIREFMETWLRFNLLCWLLCLLPDGEIGQKKTQIQSVDHNDLYIISNQSVID
jgi:RNA polymerase sigma-70 factor (ECF subfamily)